MGVSLRSPRRPQQLLCVVAFEWTVAAFSPLATLLPGERQNEWRFVRGRRGCGPLRPPYTECARQSRACQRALRRWHGQAERQPKPGGQHLVRQDTNMLWIVRKFGHVCFAVGRPQQVGLRSSPEFAQVLDGRDADRHGSLLCFELGIEAKTESVRELRWARAPPAASTTV